MAMVAQFPWFLLCKKATEQSHRGGRGGKKKLRRDAGVLSAMVGAPLEYPATPPRSPEKTRVQVCSAVWRGTAKSLFSPRADLLQ